MRRGDAKPRRAARSSPFARESEECAGFARARSPAKRATLTPSKRATERLKRFRRERFDGVKAGGVPEHEALDVLQARGLDLILDVGEGIGAREREVL
jgi:hypothetical protein